MHDMNFFAIYKKQRAKNKNLRIFIVALLVFLLLLNGALVAGGLYLFDRMEAENQSKRDWINNPQLADSIAEAEQLSREIKIVDEYAGLLVTLDANLNNMKQINNELLEQIRAVTPATVFFSDLSITGRQISVSCQAESITDAMDMYHALMESDRFVNVSLSALAVSEETGQTNYSLSFALLEE